VADVQMTPTCPRGRDRTPGRREDDLDDRHPITLARISQDGRAGRVAGDDQRLDALRDKMVEAVEGVLTYLADRLRPVWLAGRVCEVQHRLVRQLVEHGTGDGEPTEARVEDADRRVCHVQQSTTPRAVDGGHASDATRDTALPEAGSCA